MWKRQADGGERQADEQSERGTEYKRVPIEGEQQAHMEGAEKVLLWLPPLLRRLPNRPLARSLELPALVFDWRDLNMDCPLT